MIKNKILNVSFERFIFIFTIVVVVVGVLYFSKGISYWSEVVALDAILWVLACFAFAYFLKYFFPARSKCLFLLILFSYLVAGIGFLPVLTVGIYFLISHAIGFRILKNAFKFEDVNHSAALVVGLVFNIALFGILIHFPINTQNLYLVIFACFLSFCILSFHDIKSCYVSGFTRGIVQLSEVNYLVLVIAAALVAWVCRFAFVPSVGFDDNVLHLRMWTELLNNKSYSFNVSAQIWSVAPFVVGLQHAVLSLLSGSDSRGALNLVLLISILWQLYCLSKEIGLEFNDRVLIVLLLISTPMMGYLMTGLQTELFLSFLCAIGIRIIAQKKLAANHVIAVLAIIALFVATKLPGAVLGVLILFSMLVKFRLTPLKIKLTIKNSKSNVDLVLLLLIFVIFLFVALHSYLISFIYTGNPLFPLYNGIFKSPYYYPESFLDTTWSSGRTLMNYVNVFFKTSKFNESENFVAGFQYLLLLPLSLWVFFPRNKARDWTFLLIPLFGFGVVMFCIIQYWRYLTPVFFIACAVIAVSIKFGTNNYKLIVRGVAIACIGLNFYFYPGISWLLGWPMQSVFSVEGKGKYIQSIAGNLDLNKFLNEFHPGSRVLYLSSQSYGATLNGYPLYVNWYSPNRQDKFLEIDNLIDAERFLKDEKVDFVVWDVGEPASRVNSKPSTNSNWLTREYLSKFGYPVMQSGRYILYRVGAAGPLYELLYDSVTESTSKIKDNLSINDGLLADQVPRLIADMDVSQRMAARYSVKFQCDTDRASFIAQINWDVGEPYYRFVDCQRGAVDFSEAMPIPLNAKSAHVYITARDINSILVERVTIEVY